MKSYPSKSQYMRNVTSNNDKNKVTKEYRKLLSENNLTTGHLNKEKRILLSEAIFIVENEIEHKSGGNHHLSTQKRVDELRNARNIIYDHIGWNDY